EIDVLIELVGTRVEVVIRAGDGDGGECDHLIVTQHQPLPHTDRAQTGSTGKQRAARIARRTDLQRVRRGQNRRAGVIAGEALDHTIEHEGTDTSRLIEADADDVPAG